LRLPVCADQRQPFTAISLIVAALTSRTVRAIFGDFGNSEFPENPAINPAANPPNKALV